MNQVANITPFRLKIPNSVNFDKLAVF